MKKRYLHPLGWFAFFLYHVSEDLVDGTFDWMSLRLSFSYVLSMVTCFYFFYPAVWKRTIGQKQYGWLIVAVPVGILIFIATRFLLEEVVYRALTGYGNYRDPYQVGYILDNTFRPISVILLSLVAWLLQQQGELREKRATLEKEKITAELGFLRSQINPHFLFNTLGFIQSRVFKVDAEAAEIITELSSILRRSLANSDVSKMPLKDELDLVRSLHGIMKKRFDGKCFIEYEIDYRFTDDCIEPLLLMPMAENMFKHGDLRSEDHPGRISVNGTDELIRIRFSNRKMKGTPHQGSGIGLGNTQKRLDLLFPNMEVLKVFEDSDNFSVEIEMPRT